MSGDNDVEALRGFVGSILSEVNTSMPGVIVSYDPATNLAVVRGLIPKKATDGSVEECPQIVKVPISWPAGSGGHLTFPLAPGDGVNLHFSQRALDGWQAGTNAAPDDPRSYDLQDATAVPGTQVTGISADPDAARLSFGGSTVRLTKDGTVEHKTAGGTFTMDASGKFTVTAPGGFAVESPTFTHNGKNVGAEHKHLNVQSGGGISGVPQ